MTNYRELVRIESWRLDCLLEAGYPITLAVRVAQSEADLHRAVALVKDGCPPGTAVRILL